MLTTRNATVTEARPTVDTRAVRALPVLTPLCGTLTRKGSADGRARQSGGLDRLRGAGVLVGGTGSGVGVGGAVPLPLTVTLRGLVGVLSVIRRIALRSPEPWGVKPTAMVQVLPAGTMAQLLEGSVKSAPAVPDRTALLTIKDAPPVLLIVSVRVRLLVPTICGPKVRVLGVTVARAPTKARLWSPPAAIARIPATAGTCTGLALAHPALVAGSHAWPTPNWPDVLLPHAQTVPSARRATLC